MPLFPEQRIADHGAVLPSQGLADELADTEQDEKARARRILTKNRRKRYLDLHEEYFSDSNLELADPLLYDRLVRRFQSAEEREREGRHRGFSGLLEANFARSEAKLDALAHPDPNSPLAYTRGADGSITGVEQDEDERARSREEGWERWKDAMTQRFLRGDDADFEYSGIDESEEYDDRDEEERSKQDEYFGKEDEAFVGEGRPQGQSGVQDF